MSNFKFKKTDNKKWPYQLTEVYEWVLPESWNAITFSVDTEYVKYNHVTRTLTMAKTYAWNGADVAIDTDTIMRSSLVHDAICQLVNLGALPFRPCRKLGDKELYTISRQDGMFWARAAYVYVAVRLYAVFVARFK